MEPFASVTDYISRYPADAADFDQDSLLQCLMDATDVICAELDASNVDYQDPSESFTARLRRVCRTMAHRAIASSITPEIPFGATQFSQTAGSYTHSSTLANPYGDLFLTKQERRSLGIGAARAVVISPYGADDA